MSTVLLAGVAVGGIASSVGYIAPWHSSEAKAFFQRLERDIDARGRVDLADRVLPEDVMSQLAAPRNNLSFLAPLLTTQAHFPDQTTTLFVVDDSGRLRRAAISSVLTWRAR